MFTTPLSVASVRPNPAALWDLAAGEAERETPVCTSLAEAQAALAHARRTIARQEERIRQLESLSQHDELTGLGNRAALSAALRREIALTRRDRKNAGFLVLIQLNDPTELAQTHGRACADLFMQRAASALLNEVRSSDTVCALGGGLFAVVMPQIDVRSGANRLAKLETSLDARCAHIRALTIPYEARVGFAFIEECETPESLMIAADARLYATRARKG